MHTVHFEALGDILEQFLDIDSDNSGGNALLSSSSEKSCSSPGLSVATSVIPIEASTLVIHLRASEELISVP
jgi:hypothetical protein